MGTESSSIRRNKRIVEHIISGFATANEAIVFGSTVEQVVIDMIGEVKFRQGIGAPDTAIVITKDWTGPTVLKTMFLELLDQNTAIAICEAVKKTISSHEEVHRTLLRIDNEVVREKPQPQFIG